MHKKKKEFKQDYSKSNPGLHLLHVKWACKHLLLLDKVREQLWNQSNNNLNSVLIAIDKEITKLIHTNKAYSDAFDIIVEMNEIKPIVMSDEE